MTDNPNGTILIVDDTKENLHLLTYLLTKNGYLTHTAKNGAEGLNAIQTLLPDLILLDIRLPDVSGFEVCEQLKANKATREIPVIFISALHETKDIQKGFEVGGIDYIIRPFNSSEVIVRVKTQIEMSSLRKCLKQQSADLQRNNKILETRNNLLTALINSQKDIIIFALDRNYCYTTFNDRHRQEMKVVWNTDIEIGTNLLDCMSIPELKDSAKQSIDRALQGEVLFEIKHQPGVEKYYELIWNPIYLSNEIIGVTCFIRDITDKTLAEEKIMLSEQNFRNVFEHSAVGISMTSIDGTLRTNAAYCKIIGYTSQEISQLKWKDITYPADTENDDKIINTILSGKESTASWEKRYIHKKGHVIWVDITTSLQRDKHGSPLYFITTINDITERKKTELLLVERKQEIEAQNNELLQSNKELFIAKKHAEESDQLKTAFLHNISHEIRTPMNAIMGFSSLLTQHYGNQQKLDEFSTIINYRCEDLLNIINQIVDVSKIESGQLPVRYEECSLDVMFEDLTKRFLQHQEQINKKHIDFCVQRQYDKAESTIIADIEKVKQILANLISNAFKFTDHGTITTGCKIDTSQNLLFYVSDTGIGIPLEKQHLIFKRFTKIDHGNERLYGGTGLGLTIVKGLINLLNGKIWFESEVNKGTTFYFSIPFKTAKAKIVKPTGLPDTKAVFAGQTILIVEDDIHNTIYLKEILSGTGLRILHSIYGNDAVHIALTEQMQLVLLDILLPDIDGYEVIRQIKQQKPNLKIIAYTAYSTYDDKLKALMAGCDDYISKPASPDLLLSVIQMQLNITN